MGGKTHSTLSQKAVFYTHWVSKTPALPSLGLAVGFPAAFQDTA